MKIPMEQIGAITCKRD